MYNTDNPIPSAALEDMADNAQTFDALVTKTDGTTTDRKGVNRRVFQQIIMDMGFQPLSGSFQTGATITARNQCLQDTSTGTFYSWGGTLPKVVAAGSTPSTSGGIGAGAWVDRTDLMAKTELTSYINTLEKHEFDSLTTAASMDLPVGFQFVVNDTVFKVSDEKPLAAYIPVIPGYGGTYLIPTSNTLKTTFSTLDISTSQVIPYTDTIQISHQAIYVDNRRNSILFVTVSDSTEPQKFTVREYAFTGGVVGSLLLTTGTITYGHGDYFAVVYDAAGDRHLWYHNASVSTFGGGALSRIKLEAGASAPQVTVAYPSAFTSKGVKVENAGANKIRLWTNAGYWELDVNELSNGSTLSLPEEDKFAYTWYHNVRTLPSQQYRLLDSQIVALDGVDTSIYGTCRLSVTDSKTGITSTLPINIVTTPLSLVGTEPEGVALLWDAVACKYDIVMSLIRGSTSKSGNAYLFNTTKSVSGDVQAGRSEYKLTAEKITGLSDFGQWGSETLIAMSGSPLYAPRVCFGTFNGKNNTAESAFGQFYADQWYGDDYTGNSRKQCRIRAFKDAFIVFDGDGDSAFTRGVRIGFNDYTPIQFRPRTVTIGPARESRYVDTFYPRVEMLGSFTDALIPAGISSGIVGQVFGCTLDIAAETGTVLQFGDYNKTTGAYNIWYNMNASNFHAGTDNTRACGAASVRWSVVYAATGTINTSDEREKTFRDEELSDAVLDVWSGINWRTFKFNDAVVEKGEAARVHFGLGAQTIKNAFEAAGLDPFRYALLCYDEWDETPAQYGENGNEIAAAIPAGNRYGIRYEEALALEAALLRRTTLRLDARLAALEAK